RDQRRRTGRRAGNRCGRRPVRRRPGRARPRRPRPRPGGDVRRPPRRCPPTGCGRPRRRRSGPRAESPSTRRSRAGPAQGRGGPTAAPSGRWSMNRMPKILPAAALVAVLLVAPARAQESDAVVAQLNQQLVALDANPDTATLAAYERLQARQALETLANARSSQYDVARYVAERRVQVAEVAARTEAMHRQIDRLERTRSELIVEASRRDAAEARAEAERLRIQARIQAEEAARLRAQATNSAEAMEDIESALKDIGGAEAARLKAARAREAELARQEAELLRQAEEASDD